MVIIIVYSAGCFCPNGTVRHNGECISIDDCPKSMLLLLLIGVEAVAKWNLDCLVQQEEN